MNDTVSISNQGLFGLPYGGLELLDKGSLAVFGVPFEEPFGLRRGTREAPDALRRMSLRGGLTESAEGVDLGNLPVTKDWASHLGEIVSNLKSRGAIPLVLGGDDEVGAALVNAMPGLMVVAATPEVKPLLVERSPSCLWLGLNGEQNGEVWNLMQSAKHTWRTARQLDTDPQSFPVPQEDVILWIDISVLDLGLAAGAVRLNPGGIKPETLVKTLEQFSSILKGIVVTGLAPTLDPRGISELSVVESIWKIIHHA